MVMSLFSGRPPSAAPTSYDEAKSILARAQLSPNERLALSIVVDQADHRPRVNDAGRCDNCGGRPANNEFSLSEFTVKLLYVLAKAGPGSHRVSELLEANSPPHGTLFSDKAMRSRNNFCHLRYWDLIEQPRDEKGRKRHGWWLITQRGRDFVEGDLRLPRTVIVYTPGTGSVVQGFKGPELSAREVDTSFKTHEEYIATRHLPTFVDPSYRHEENDLDH